MINSVYQLVDAKTFAVKFEDVPIKERVVVRPRFMALCHADQRYYLGSRGKAVMGKKLPMALVHESCGIVLFDDTGTFEVGQPVAMVPNVPGENIAGIYENYAKGSGFLSSGRDGFMRELVSLDADRLVSCDGIDYEVAAIVEFISVAVHAASRFDEMAHEHRCDVAVIGDGSLAYSVANVLRCEFPDITLHVVGRHAEKLALFSSFAETHFEADLSSSFTFDHAFECTGGQGCESAIQTAIDHVNPQGSIMLMGVNETSVPVYTRDVLEKGLSLIGCSRSGRKDFERAVELLRDTDMQRCFRRIIFVDDPVRSIADIKRVFATDLSTPFKTVFEWLL